MGSVLDGLAPNDIARRAKAAFGASQLVEPSERIKALQSIKTELEVLKKDIYEANKADLEVFASLNTKSDLSVLT